MLSLYVFLISLLAISILIGRKFNVLKNLNNNEAYNFSLDEELYFTVPDLDEIKKGLWKKTRKFSYAVLFVTIKVYLISSNAVKKQTNMIVTKVKNKIKIRKNSEEEKPKEISRFLKMISEYKEKIQKIKNRIKKEEGLN